MSDVISVMALLAAPVIAAAVVAVRRYRRSGASMEMIEFSGLGPE